MELFAVQTNKGAKQMESNLGTIEAKGSLVIESEKVLRKQKVPVEKLAQAVQILAESIRLGDPSDIRVPLCEVRMATNGGLFRAGKGEAAQASALGYTSTALSHLVASLGEAPRGTKGVLEYLDPEARSVAFNSMARRVKDSSTIVLRTSLLGSGVLGAGDGAPSRRVVRAVTRPKHSLSSGDDASVIQALARTFPLDTPTRIVRSWDRTDFELFFPTRSVMVARGDVTHAKVWAWNSETKGSSFEAHGGLFRLVCLNGMTKSAEGVQTSVRHVGSVEYRIQAALKVAMVGVEDFAREFSNAYSIPLKGTEADILERLSTMKALPESTLAAAKHLWHVDGTVSAGHTVAGLANALTRAAQAESMSVAAEVEAFAGELVSSPVKYLAGMLN